MRATELRIGNLIEQGEIEIISNTSVWINENPLLIDEIEPIPLTEEWLLRFGFTSIMNNCIFQKINFLGNIYSRKKSFFFEYVFLKVELKHVHQLQNLYFALTGKEI